MERKFDVRRDFDDLAKSIEADPHHVGLNAVDFLLEKKTQTQVWEDEQGPVFYFRISRELRVDVQFRPEVSPERIRRGITEGVAWLEGKAEKAGFRAIIFDSVYRPLILFCKRLGFTSYPDLRKDINHVRCEQPREANRGQSAGVLRHADERIQDSIR